MMLPPRHIRHSSSTSSTGSSDETSPRRHVASLTGTFCRRTLVAALSAAIAKIPAPPPPAQADDATATAAAAAGNKCVIPTKSSVQAPVAQAAGTMTCH